MKLKKILAILMCVVVLPFAFIGCTPKEDELVVPVGPVDDGDLVFNDKGNIVYDNVTINMWSVTTGDDARTQDSIIARFNEQYEGMIRVNVTHKSRYDLEGEITTSIEFDRKNLPELLFSHGSRANEYASKNWLLPLEQYMTKAGLVIDRDDYVGSLLSATTVKGLVFGLPQDVHSAMVVYRKDILEKNGLPIPSNYDELCNVCDRAVELAKAGNLYIRGYNSEGKPATEWRKAPASVPYYPFPMAYGDMWVHEFAGYTAAVQNGGTFVGADGMPGWNTSKVNDGLTVLREMVFPSDTSVNRYPLTEVYDAEYDVGNAPMRMGNCIFKLLGPWEYINDLNDYDALLRADGGSGNIGTMPMSGLFAKDKDADYANKIKGEGHAFMMFSTVTSRTKQCAAMIFADWMVNNASVDWAKRGHLPSLKSVENSSDYREDPAYDAYIKNWGSCDDYVVIQPTPYYSYVDSYFKNCVKKSMADSFKKVAINSILREEYDDCVSYIDLFA